MQIKIPCYQVRKLGEDKWLETSEKMVMESLAECFDIVSPVVLQLLEGNEVIARQEIYRIKC
jgi:hypothetical protein